MNAEKESSPFVPQQTYLKISIAQRFTESTKKASFWLEFKKNWINKWFNFALVGFCAVFLGGIFGWTIYEVVDSLFAWIRGLF